MSQFLHLSIITLALAVPNISISQPVYKCGNTFSQAPCSSDAKKVDLKPAIPVDCDSFENRYSSYCTEKEKKRQESVNAAIVAEKEKKEQEEKKLAEIREKRKEEEAQMKLDFKRKNDNQGTRICRAAIAAMMGRPVEIINFTEQKGDVIYTTYIRPSDNTAWNNRCRIAGNSVIWSSENGRWRNSPQDEKVTFEVENGTIFIHQKYSDGSTSSKRYTKDRLEPI